MISGILVAHGFDAGPRYQGKAGWEYFEDKNIKSFLEETFWNGMTPGRPMKVSDSDVKTFLQFCDAQDRKAHWLCKVGCEYYPLFRRAFPRMVAVLVKRNVNATVRALVGCTDWTQDRAETITRARFEYLDKIWRNDPFAYRVLSDTVAAGGFGVLAAMCRFRFGITFSNEVAKQVINRGIWNE